MNPKEKANNLIQIFSKLEKGLEQSDWNDREVVYDCFHIKCALVIVNEILEDSSSYYSIENLNYFSSVKYELKKCYEQIKKN
jgi:hypothetical protein